ncbi:3-oxoacyl-[acyl-carrier-protein] reductase /acetoacetyl-CoA reductase [Thermolongibacillus altinsuensis]|jgi:acetoacetyl-CoA reductase|uniref:3-oxoacyl-[acyl-carrier-protein] reductase /acetoacetyl-CoA reductase n=1 Tax=Thermolongibacillus altinsuensis TaxID=575256 RepID=A0A4R1QLW7_9BACL|nr:3-oxoacyl-ACP reductase [Thermolongibacillus altinsuensis]TCL49287.1 3-oxoacyl-[acyl-carrier-protein] reductase /acetoacetyl-CoA reductase [Thermolongibacillus altinsuensis]GMB10117.1 acetoacetyl-CoA reductase [Thermolongibacillus altinsuensis]
MVELKGKVAIVTGGGKGIGATIAKQLAENGVKVVINYNRSSEAAKKVVQSIHECGGEAIAVQADVSVLEEAKKLVEIAMEKYEKLDILVNNAGITRDRTFKKLSEEDWHKVIDINLNSVYNMTAAALPHIMQSEAGRIINISSIIGQAGGFGQTNYAAAKAGMIGFTKSLALELAKTGVTVNAICPGFIETDMLAEVPEQIKEQIKAKIPMRRFGHADEIARGVLFLCRDGEYMTGQQLNMNGGLYM